MKSLILLSVACIVLLIFETVYFALGGRLILYFMPQFFLLMSGLVGVIFGGRVAIFWGAIAGILEEVCFIGFSEVLGITPLVYCWNGYLASCLFFGRVDSANPTIGSIVSATSLIFGFLVGNILGVAFSTSADLVSGSFGMTRLVSWIVQIILVGPLLFKTISGWASPDNGEAKPYSLFVSRRI